MADDPFYRKLREMTSLDPKIKTGSHVPLLNRITLGAPKATRMKKTPLRGLGKEP